MGRIIRTGLFLIFLILALIGCEIPFGQDDPPTPLPTAEPQPPAEPETAAEPAETPAITAVEEPSGAPTAKPESRVAPETETAPFEPGRCPFDVPADAEVICGTVELPQNRSSTTSGQTVELAVAIFKSEAANPAAEPVVYLSGGPGGHALELIPFTYESDIKPFLTARDYVVFDQRGTGFSQPSLACPETFELDLDLLDDNLSQDEYGDRYLEALADCRQRLVTMGVDLSAFNSAENAADVDALRQALGYDSWHLFGVSYGTRLAQTVMRDHPEGVASVILDSPYPLEVDLQEAVPGHVTRAFRVFFDGCAADPICQAAYPDLESTFYDTVDQLNETPIEFPIVYFLNGTEYDVVFNGDDLIDILFQSLYSSEIFPLLPRVITEVGQGTTDTLGILFATFLVNGEFISTGMYRSVQCYEELAFSDLAAVEAASAADPLLAGYFANWDLSYEACDLWDSGAADPMENEPVVSDIPTLVLTGEYDPITPPFWGELVAENLTNETLLEFPGIGHGIVSSAECPLQIALDFLKDQNVADVTGCIAQMGSPPFDASPVGGESVSDEIILIPFELDLPQGGTLVGVRPDGWDENGPGIYLRGQTLLDQAGVIFQAVPIDLITAEEYVAFFIDQLNASVADDAEPELFDDSSGRTWSINQADLVGAPIFIAVSENEEQVIAVVMVTNPDDQTFLREALFEPGLNEIDVK